MPGSPPTSRSDPGAKPPPSVRSSSGFPLLIRFTSPPEISEISRGPSEALSPRGPVDGGRGSASSREDQAPHSGHLPAHFVWTDPQATQRKTFGFFFATRQN